MDKKLKILRLQLITNSSSAPFNNFTLKTLNRYKIFTVSYKSDKKKFSQIKYFYDSGGKIIIYLKNIKNILSKEEIDIIHIHSVHCGIFFIIHCILNKQIYLLKKTVFTVHNSYQNYKLRNKILFFINFFSLKKIVFCSFSSFNSFPKFIHTINKKIKIIPNGVDISKMKKTKVKEFNKRLIDIIFVGRMEKVKNAVLISNLLSAFENKIIYFIGDGSLIQKVKNILRKNKNVTFRGQIPREAVYKNLADSKFFISMSKTEGLPIALLEAIYMGCIPIVSDIEPHKEVLGEYSNFIISKNLSRNELIDKINGLLNLNFKNSLFQDLRNLVEKKYSLDKMLNGYDKLYKKII